MEPEAFANQLNRNHLAKAYLRLAAEAKKIKENPASYGIKGEPEKLTRKPKKPKQEPPAEQLRMF